MEDSKSTAKLLASHGIDYFIEAAFTTELFSKEINISQQDGIIITSKNAIRAIREINHNVKIISLGKATTSFAKERGFMNVEYAGKNSSELCQYIKATYTDKSFVYASGKTITTELNKINCGNNINRIIVYETIPQKTLSKEFKAKLLHNDFSGIMFFSKKTAEIFFKILKKEGLELHIQNLYAFCLSNNIAEFIKSYGFKATMYPENPNIAEIIKLVVRFRF